MPYLLIESQKQLMVPKAQTEGTFMSGRALMRMKCFFQTDLMSKSEGLEWLRAVVGIGLK